MKHHIKTLFTISILLSSSAVLAQPEEEGAHSPISVFELFYSQKDTIPVLQLETDWGLLIKNKLNEEYQPATIAFQKRDGKKASMEVKLRARGNARKQVCVYPPVKIKLPKKELAALGFESSHNKLKLVVPCRGGKANEDCLLREALAYQLYEPIHPIHIRAKVIRLQHWEGGKKAHSFFALLVEEEEEMESRINGRLVKQGSVSTAILDRDAYLKMSFFQYMIANTDWAVPNRHNLEIVQAPGYQRLIPIPYDFDYAGMAGTHYAVPASSLPISDVSQRLFLGKYVTEDEALATARFFQVKEEELLRICNSFELLKDRHRTALREFLSTFFEEIRDEEMLRKKFVKK